MAFGIFLHGVTRIKCAQKSSSTSASGWPKRLQKAVTDKTQKELFSVPLLDVARVAGREHGREVEQCHVGFSVMIKCEIEVRELVVRTIVTSILDVVQKRRFVDVFGIQKFNGIFQILENKEFKLYF